jgi:hypothetical protein
MNFRAAPMNSKMAYELQSGPLLILKWFMNSKAALMNSKMAYEFQSGPYEF